jgi:probable phosphoglycerate mutase
MATRKPPSGTLVLLVRHGTTPTTGRVLPGRAPGLHLADSGREQAARVAERLGSLALSAVYTSPLERACETAAPTADATGLTPVIEPGLAECDTGDWTGESLATLARRAEWRALAASPSTFRFPGGESFAELAARVVAVLDRLQAEHRGEVVACFTHADPVKVALTYALGAHLDAFQRLSIGTGSVSAIRFTPGSPPVVPAVNSMQGPLTHLVTGE